MTEEETTPNDGNDIMESRADHSQVEGFSNTQLQIDQLPKWEDIEFEPMAKNAAWEPFIQSLIFISFLMAAVIAAPIIGSKSLLYSLPILAGILLLFGLSQWHNFASHRPGVRGIALREKDIGFKKGLIWKSRTMLPFNRVQHIEIHRNPFERKLGLSSLRIFSAGGSGVDLQISGLENDRAERIKQYILEASKSETA